jgi:hypothetical protein
MFSAAHLADMSHMADILSINSRLLYCFFDVSDRLQGVGTIVAEAQPIG